MRVLLLLVLALGCVPSQPSGAGPISAAPAEWTWVAFSEALCANGSSTGLGLNPALADGGDVVVYLAGGGACWDAASCYLVKSAWNVELGYGAAQFASERLRGIPLFDRRAAANPFASAHFVFVPYCTGDLHVGTATKRHTAGVDTRHVGARNLDAFLARLGPTFSSARRVFVVGTSAGGFGAQMNAWRFAAAFPSAEVHVLGDSAALVRPGGARWSEWLAAWEPQAPPGCTACRDGPGPWLSSARAALHTGRLGLISSEEDGLLATFTGLTASQFRDEVRSLTRQHFATAPSAAFVTPGARHIFLDEWTVAQNGVGLSAWLQAFHDGERFESP
ncbi:MAG: hypothetical protein JNJ54_25640 [Myxococcaceae bacterium]|nr:hypothetical protein [Myxococcaceae bacterium]